MVFLQQEAKRAEKLAEQKKKTKKDKKPANQPLKQASSWDEKSMEFQQPLRPYQKSKKSQKQMKGEGVSNLAGSQFAEPIVYVRGSQQKRKVASHVKFIYI